MAAVLGSSRCIGLIGFAFVLTACQEASQESQGFPPPQVGVLTVKSEPMKVTNTLPGRTQAFLEAEVRPQVSGILLERLFNEGSQVEKGQQLYQIDPATYQADLSRAEADLTKARANLKTAKARADRYKVLVDSEAVSKQDYDDALAQYEQALANIETATAAMRSATINLDYTKVYSPISGRAGRSSVTAGALVTANQAEPLVTVQRFDPMYVDVTESTGELAQVRQAWASGELVQRESDKGEVELIFEDGSRYEHKGDFQFADINVNPSTGSFTIRITFINPDGLLLPGMFVRAQVVEGTREAAILVPARGVTRTPTGDATVMVLDEENKVAVKAVVASELVGNRWLITSGLSDGDRVILDGLQFVRPGAPVGGVEELTQ